MVKESNLRGRGGAGFPTGHEVELRADGRRRAASEVPGLQRRRDGAGHVQGSPADGRRSAPADRRHDHRRLRDRGRRRLHLSALGEYKLAARDDCSRRSPRRTRHAISAGTSSAPAYSLELYLHISAGRYICGEETALLNALEGKRANPALEAAVPAGERPLGQADGGQQRGDALQRAAHRRQRRRWFKSLSHSDDGGTKLYGVSGKVKRPGSGSCRWAPPIREILEEHAGGMRDGVRFRGVLPGGASTDFLDRRAPRRADGLRLGAEGRQPPGHRHHDRPRRQDLPGRHGAGTWSNSSRRSRAAGARRAGAALAWAEQMLRAMEEGDGQPDDLERLAFQTQLLGARPHLLRARARRGRAAAERAEILPRRFRAAHPRKALSVENRDMATRCATIDDQAVRHAERDSRTCCTPACRSASTCPISAGIRRWARWAPAASARSSSSGTRRTRTARS